MKLILPLKTVKPSEKNKKDNFTRYLFKKIFILFDFNFL